LFKIDYNLIRNNFIKKLKSAKLPLSEIIPYKINEDYKLTHTKFAYNSVSFFPEIWKDLIKRNTYSLCKEIEFIHRIEKMDKK